MNPRIPSLVGVVLHLLIGAMATVYLIAAGLQIHRGDYMTALINLVITALLGVLLEFRKGRYGRFFANFTMRRRVKGLRREENCAWCGESIEVKAPAISHRGAMGGQAFHIHHHVECDKAVHHWYQANDTGSKREPNYPPTGSMQRGSPQPRDTD